MLEKAHPLHLGEHQMTHRRILLATCLLGILATNAAGQSVPARAIRDLHFEMAVELLRDASVALRVQSMAGNDYRPHIDILKEVATEDFLQQLKSTSGLTRHRPSWKRRRRSWRPSTN